VKARDPSSPLSAMTQRRHRELPWGKTRHHLPEVEGEGVLDIEEVEECLGPRPVPRAPRPSPETRTMKLSKP
jgi:hypothetical protein